MQPDREGTHTSSDKVSIYRTGFSYSTAELWNICMLQVAKGSMFKTVQLSASHHFLCFTMSNHHGDSGGFHSILHSLHICIHTESHFGILNTLCDTKCITYEKVYFVHTHKTCIYVNISRICTHILICHYSVCICSIATFQCSVLLTCLHPFLYI